MSCKKWWALMEYPDWDEGPDGFPRPGQVVAHFRQQKIKEDGHPWTQKDLAKALGISEQSVIKMEKRDVGLDSLTRRQFLIDIFAIPYILMRMAPKPEQATTMIPHVEQGKLSTIHTIDLPSLKADWHSYWTNNHRRTAQASLKEIAARIGTLYQVLPFTSEEYAVLEILCLYHILIAGILRDQQLFKEAIEHLNRAVKFAKRIEHYELRVDALFRRGGAYFDSGNIEDALSTYRAAEKLLPKVSHYMGGAVLLELGHAQTKSTQDETGRRQGLNIMDKAAHIIRTSKPSEDEHYLKLDISRYHIDKSAALIGIGWNVDAETELTYVQRNPDLLRRNAYSDILEAQALANQGKYPQATSIAESAIVIVKDIKSAVNYARVVKLHMQLKASSFGNDPEVARLTYLLQPAGKLGER